MTLIAALKRRWWALREMRNVPRRFRALVLDPQLTRSYFPHERRKSRTRIALELLWWLLRHGEINHYYYVYGLDREGHETASYLSWREFRHRRNALNKRPRGVFEFYEGRYDYLCLTRDKFLFGQYLSSLSIPTPPILALLNGDSVVWTDTGDRESLEGIASRLGDGSWFCKPVDGIGGQDVFELSVCDGQLCRGGAAVAPRTLARQFEGRRYLLQERLLQHAEMDRLYPSAINTLRVVTVARRDGIQIFSTTLRMGAHGIRTDNWASGGIILRIDPAMGRGVGQGFFKPGNGLCVSVHPDTRTALDGFAVPHFRECADLARHCHRYFYGLHSIGWDVAITTDGPSVIEGNDDWDGVIPMTLEPDFRARFEASFPRVGTGPQRQAG